MPPKTFQDLFDAIAAHLGLPTQALEPDEAGQLSFRLDIEGSGIDVVQCADSLGQPVVVVAADLGPMPGRGDGLLPTSLLNANLMMASARGPVFGRDPHSGHILLHQCHALSELDGPRLQGLVAVLSEAARWWRSDMFRQVCQDLAQASPGRSAPGEFA